jgi:hypothetical protein
MSIGRCSPVVDDGLRGAQRFSTGACLIADHEPLWTVVLKGNGSRCRRAAPWDPMPPLVQHGDADGPRPVASHAAVKVSQGEFSCAPRVARWDKPGGKSDRPLPRLSRD